MNNKLTIIRGLPGSGKSTLAKEMIKSGEAHAHFEADMYMLDINGNYKFDASKLHRAHVWCQESAKSAYKRIKMW